MAFTITLPAIIPTINDFEKSAPIGLSPLGTPLFDDIHFLPGKYTTDDGYPVDYSGLHIISAKVVVAQSKNIVKTKISGRDGSIKEYVSLNDYSININAKITELFNLFPADQLTAWTELSKVPQNVKIISKLLNKYFDIYYVVIDNFNVSPVQGSLNEVNLSMTLLSDEIIDLKEFIAQ